jgi:hypothetical protein
MSMHSKNMDMTKGKNYKLTAADIIFLGYTKWQTE